jgi:hypothetical protein
LVPVPRTKVTKQCSPSYVINSTTGANEVELVCSHESNAAKPEFRVAGTGAPEPLCTQYCTSNDDCVPDREACVFNRWGFKIQDYLIFLFWILAKNCRNN